MIEWMIQWLIQKSHMSPPTSCFTSVLQFVVPINIKTNKYHIHAYKHKTYVVYLIH